MTATKPLPAHGTTARAAGRPDGTRPPCYCPPCRDVIRRYDKQQAYDCSIGRRRVGEATDTATTIERLISCGMTVVDIARAADCHPNTVRNARKPGARVNVRTAAAISKVQATLSASTPISALGATRRIRAALTRGHSETAFAVATGLKLPYISELAAGLRDTVLPETHDRIDAGYRLLIAGPAPAGRGASRARNRARAAGWPTPEQWDDEIDNPDADPALWLRSTESRDFDGLAEDVEFVVRTTGASFTQAAARIGISRDALYKARERAGLTNQTVAA